MAGTIGRRDFVGGVMSAIVAGGCTTLSAPSAAPKGEGGAMFVYVGCYTTKQRNARGEGINVYSMDRTSGIWTHVQLVKDLVNPSWLALDQQQRVLYSAHGDGEVVTALSIDRSTGQLKVLGQQATGGKNGVRIAVDSTNKFLVCANYSSGTVAVLPIAPDGSLGPLTDLVSLTGTPGPHRTEQSSPHPHDVPFDRSGRFVVVPDKGLDKQKCGTACSNLAMGVAGVVQKVCENGSCVVSPLLKIDEICQVEDKCTTSFCDQQDPNTARCVNTVCPQQGSCCCGAPGGAKMCAQKAACTGERSCM